MLAGIGGYYFVQSQEDAKRGAAKAQTKVLTEACDAYRISHGTYPASLAVLLQQDEEGGPYLKNQEALIDPWKQMYQYNAQGPNNSGRQPDIWSNSPNGHQIGNWAGSK
jgi:type II secretory pathway pseudopilin PulG